MNDRFKFRFWREHYDGKFTLECADLMSIDGSADPYNVGEGDVYCYHPGETIIEQCTGLKDKNGKLIYEGDILSDYDGFKFIVRWDALELRYVFIPVLKNNTEDLDIYPNECELVGNIHENPELLK